MLGKKLFTVRANAEKKSVRSLMVATAIATALSSTAYAAERRNVLLEEVMVTASKKGVAESSQDVPIAITAYSGDQVEAMFAVNLTDIGVVTPNASLTELATFPGVANFVIRGMGTVGQSVPSADPAVGVVVDGISLGTIYGVVTDLFDLESIEILRGPQGTLFGPNATGGAISMRSVRPSDEFYGRVRAGVGNYGKTDLSLLVSGPINENWGGKLAVLSKDRDGYWNHITTGEKRGASETRIVRPALRFHNDNSDHVLIGEHGEIESDGLTGFGWEADGVKIADPYSTRQTNGRKGSSELEWSSLVLESNWNIWDGVLTSVLGWRDMEQFMDSDLDGLPTERFSYAKGTNLVQDQISAEVRWSGNITDNLILTSGFYYFDQEYTYGERRILVSALDRRGESTLEHEMLGLFGQIDYAISDDLTLTLGGRYTKEEKTAAIGVIGDPNAVGDCATLIPPASPSATTKFNDCQQVFNDNNKWSNFAPKLGVNWAITEDIMAYASYSIGYRSGGYNVRFTDLSYATNPATAASTPGPYDEETVDAYEIGVKTELLDNRVRLNVSAFYNDYKDLQRTALNSEGGQQILNAASAAISGVEVELTASLTERLVLQAGLGLIDAGYDEFLSAEIASGKRAKDLKLVLAPDDTYNVALTYSWDLGDVSTLDGRISYSYVDETYSDDLNLDKNEDYELVDVSLTYNHESSGLQVSLFGKNVFDEIYYNFGVDLSGSALGFKGKNLTPPRTYGVEVTYDF